MAGGRAVLVIDDDQQIHDLLQTILQEHGFPVRAAKRGADALEMAPFS